MPRSTDEDLVWAYPIIYTLNGTHSLYRGHEMARGVSPGHRTRFR